jgi:chromosome segregation ATPase
MNAGVHQSETPEGSTTPVEAPSSPRLINPSLSGTLSADHAALENDLVQAQELAADFQRQLAGKSNEYAQLKQILEKTQKDLEHLQAGIVELRAERHRLANEAMRAVAFEVKLEKVVGERDRLRSDMEVMRHAMGAKVDEMVIQLRDRDRRIAELVVEMVGLRQQLEEARIVKAPLPQPSIAPPDPFPAISDDVEVEIMPTLPSGTRRK